MPLSITLQISEAEIEHFRSHMRRVRERQSERSPQEIAAAAMRKISRRIP